MSRRRTLVLVLPADEWKKLERQALENDRDPFQQARWLLRQALGDGGREMPREPDREDPLRGANIDCVDVAV